MMFLIGYHRLENRSALIVILWQLIEVFFKVFAYLIFGFSNKPQAPFVAG